MPMAVPFISVSPHVCYVHLHNQGWVEKDGKTLKDDEVISYNKEDKTLSLNGTFTADDLMALAVALNAQ